MALYGALAKHRNLADLFDAAAARANLGIAGADGISPNANQFYVDSGHTNAADVLNAGTKTTPFATWDFAIGQCTENNGDVIYLLPGHAEDIATDAGVALDVAGITTVGLGHGSDMPTITVSTATAANISVTTANQRIFGIRFKSNLVTLVNILEIAGDSCEVAYCEFDESTLSALTCIQVSLANADADDTWIHHNKFFWDQPGVTNAGDEAIQIGFDNDRILIEDNFIYGDFDVAGIHVPVGGNASDFLVIRNNYIENTETGQHAIQITTGDTMNGLLVYDNKLVADVPGTTAQLHTAKTWGNELLSPVGGPRHIYVDSNGGAGADTGEGTIDTPLITLDAAIALCTADHGDIIHVAAGHNENLAGADGVDCDVAGVKIIGEGVGSNKPTFDFDGTASEFVIGAAGILVENLRFRTSATAVLKAIDVEAAGTDFVIRNCDFGFAETASDEFVDAIIVNAATHNGVIEDCFFDAGAQAAATAISLSGAVIGLTIRNNTMIGDYSVACIEGISTLSENLVIEDNLLWNGVTANLGTVACITLVTGTVGIIRNNDLATNVTSPHLAIVADGCFLSRNTYQETAGVSNTNLAVDGVAFNPILGFRARAADAQSPNGTVLNIFTIVGGKVLVTRLSGQVGTVVQAAQSIWKITHNPTVGNPVDLAADLECNGFDAATLLNCELDGTALVGSDGVSGLLAVAGIGAGTGAELDAGVIEWESAESTSGTAKWDLWYWPLEAGAHVLGS